VKQVLSAWGASDKVRSYAVSLRNLQSKASLTIAGWGTGSRNFQFVPTRACSRQIMNVIQNMTYCAVCRYFGRKLASWVCSHGQVHILRGPIFHFLLFPLFEGNGLFSRRYDRCLKQAVSYNRSYFPMKKVATHYIGRNRSHTKSELIFAIFMYSPIVPVSP
jgi:hypothetical protein